MKAHYVIEPNYKYGVELATWNLVRVRDKAILLSQKLNKSGLDFILGYCYAKDYDIIVL